MHKILVISLYFFNIRSTCCGLAIATQQPHISAYTKYDIQLIKRLLLKKD